MNSARRRASKDRRSAPKKKTSPDNSGPRSAADRILLAHADQIRAGRALLVLLKGTALARHLIAERPEPHWDLHVFEHFYLTALVNTLSEENALPQDAQVELFCTPDFPDHRYDTVVLPTDSRGSSELMRELLQTIAWQLSEDGRLVISTNNAKDHWLHQTLKSHFQKVTVLKHDDGICYVARRPDRSKRRKSHDCEFAFRDGERLIGCYSRPGVFSHRRVDAGARALIRSLEHAETQLPQLRTGKAKIMDMGCGCGAVATAAALRYPHAQVVAVDSHARAVQSTEKTAALNSADNVAVELTSTGLVAGSESFDLFLCNPPYYSDYRISELFLQSAAEMLRPGGFVHVVTKLSDWHENRVIEIFANAVVHRYGEYDVIVARR